MEKIQNNHINNDNLNGDILIIGDSFAADLTNIFFENKFYNKKKIITFEIPVQCRNFDIDYTIFENKYQINDP